MEEGGRKKEGAVAADLVLLIVKTSYYTCSIPGVASLAVSLISGSFFLPKFDRSAKTIPRCFQVGHLRNGDGHRNTRV